MYEHHSARLLPRQLFIFRLLRHAGLVGLLMAGSLLIGISGYMGLAGMPFVDAFMNSAMLLGGMGPVGELPNDASKFFAGCYALYAGLVFIASASVIMAPVLHRVMHGLHQRDANKTP